MATETTMFLLGELTDNIKGNKLPTQLQVLSLLFAQTKNRINLEEAINITIRKVIKFWEYTNIPLKDASNISKQLHRLHDRYLRVTKSKQRPSNQVNEDELKSDLNSLFVYSLFLVMMHWIR